MPKGIVGDGSDRPGLPRKQSRTDIPNYGPSTAVTQAVSSRRVAADIARRRVKPKISMVPRAAGGLNVFDNRSNQLIGTAGNEDEPIHRTKPRSLRVRGLS